MQVMEPLEKAMKLAKDIKSHGIECGVSINPETVINDDIISLLTSGYIDVINILAVNAGFGGQVFQKDIVLQKFKLIQGLEYKHKVKIMIDGGINSNTASLCLENVIENDGVEGVILVSGSYLFGHEVGFECGVQEMNDSIRDYYNDN